MHSRTKPLLLLLAVTLALSAGADLRGAAAPLLPTVPAGWKVELIAREPLIRNPCALAFDARGRLFVGHGPQYRNPKPDTPPDSVVLLQDRDDDGVMDEAKTFATGFNCIQGLAWHGRDLWVANAPDLTIVRDLDGDDVADEFVRVYTDLGNIEHGIHGLHWAPDGKLYFAKGNSKGLTQPGRVAPKPFRELWDVAAPPGTPDFPPPQTFKPADYKPTYQDPRDDWGREGGWLRCDDLGANLEIVARGMRNAFDIAFDSEFNALGTDNDQSEGDRIVMPFLGAHFGWGHGWSPHWTGRDHLPTVPVSGPTFSGSGTGVVYYDLPHLPPEYRGVWFVNDFLRKTIYVYRPHWDGALLMPRGGAWEEFARGGDALFKPIDVRVGPDGALYLTGWGEELGVVWREGKQANEGRVFRISWTGAPARKRNEEKRAKPLAAWSVPELLEDFGRSVEVWQIDARDELVRRGRAVAGELTAFLERADLPRAAETWAMWTLGQIAANDSEGDAWFARATEPSSPLNRRVQAIRIAGHQVRYWGKAASLPAFVGDALRDAEPRVRLAAVQAIATARQPQWLEALCTLAAMESDRVTFYAAWQAMRAIVPVEALRTRLSDRRHGVRRAALLALLESNALGKAGVQPLVGDTDAATAEVAALWLAKQEGNPLIVMEPPPGVFSGMQRVKLTPGVKPGAVRYTLDGSEPTLASRSHNTLELTETTTVKAALFVEGKKIGNTRTATWRKRASVAGGGAVALVPPSAPTKIDEVLARWRSADAENGRAVFSAAGCAACHRVGEEGRNVGPDLTAIGERGDAAHLIRSMLEPDAAITEGYALINVATRANGNVAGILAEESDRVLTLVRVDGERAVIEKADIVKRESLHRSIMPSFAGVLAPQPMADLVAWLMAQRSVAVSSAREKANAGFAWEMKADRLSIVFGAEPVADFVFKDPQVLRPHFQNVFAPGGVQVTRKHPPAPPEAVDHGTMHPGVWFAFGDINGSDFWRNKGRIEHVRFAVEPVVREGRLEFATENRLVAASGEPMGTQTLRFAFWREGDAFWLAAESVLDGEGQELVFGAQEEMGFGVRVTSALTEKNGGSVANSEGMRGAKAAWGKVAEWCEYSGRIAGRRVGVAVYADAGNPQRSWWHVRDYGLMVANAFGPRALGAESPDGKVIVAPGKSLRLRYTARFFNVPAE